MRLMRCRVSTDSLPNPNSCELTSRRSPNVGVRRWNRRLCHHHLLVAASRLPRRVVPERDRIVPHERVDLAGVQCELRGVVGVDLDLRLHFALPAAISYDSNISATKIFSWKMIFPGDIEQQYVGTEAPYILSAGAGTPRYRANWDNTFTIRLATLTATARYLGARRVTTASKIFSSIPVAINDSAISGCFA